ncbi:MAG: GntR family transcriptional regulator [Leucobacter sp.]
MSKADRAYEALRYRLIMLDIPPGEAINEVLLTAELGLGRTPIREALKRLENDHLVVSFPRRGTFATNVDIKDLAMISEIRTVLEPLVARKAARTRGGSLRAGYEETIAAIQQLHPLRDQRKLLEFDLEVHRLIYFSTDNRHLTDTLIRLDDLATRIWCVVRDRIPDISGHLREHIDLLQSILDGDEDRAAALAGEHVRHFDESVRAVL